MIVTKERGPDDLCWCGEHPDRLLTLDVERALVNAHDSLAKFKPGGEFRLTSLKAPFKAHDTWVFRCKVRGRAESIVCKIGSRNEAARAKLSNQYARLLDAHQNFKVGKYAVPEPLAFYPEECAMFMEDCRGRSLQEHISVAPSSDEIAGWLEKSGKWVSLYQAPTTQIIGFDPTPHVNWLRRKLRKHEQGEFPIPDHRIFMRCFDQLASRASDVEGLPSRQCVTHRDFHAGNIIFRKNGFVYGIDFENTKEDVAIRDVMSLLFDVLVRRDVQTSKATIEKARFFEAFRAGYADHETSEDVFTWFQAFSALNGWSNLGAKRTFSRARARRLAILRLDALTILDCS